MLQYKGRNQTAFTDITATLYVLRGTVVAFRNGPYGGPTTHTFTTTTATGVVSESLKLWGETGPTIPVVVYELAVRLTPEDNFGGRSATDVGVNERVALNFASTPSSVTSILAGGLRWSIEGPALASPDADRLRMLRGRLQQDRANDTAPFSDGMAYFKAPWATDPNSPLEPRREARTAQITLRLSVVDGVSKGMFVETSLTVHTPTIVMVSTQQIHVNQFPSAGFWGWIFYQPTKVSFHFIRFKEGSGTSVARQTGWNDDGRFPVGSPLRAIQPPPSGYFAQSHGIIHPHGPEWLEVTRGNIKFGCSTKVRDEVFSGYNKRWPNKYIESDGPGLRGKDTNVPSELIWSISWTYRPDDIETMSVCAQIAEHKAVMDWKGRVTMSKAGASVSKNVMDPTER